MERTIPRCTASLPMSHNHPMFQATKSTGCLLTTGDDLQPFGTISSSSTSKHASSSSNNAAPGDLDMAAKATTTASSSSSTTKEAAADPQADPNKGDPNQGRPSEANPNQRNGDPNQEPPAVSTTTTKEIDPPINPQSLRIQPIRQIRAVRAPPLQPPLLRLVLLCNLQNKLQIKSPVLAIFAGQVFTQDSASNYVAGSYTMAPWRTTGDNGRNDV